MTFKPNMNENTETICRNSSAAFCPAPVGMSFAVSEYIITPTKNAMGIMMPNTANTAIT